MVSADQKSDCLGACDVPENEECRRAVKVMVGNLEAVGYTEVIVCSDQEPAIVKLKSAVNTINDTRGDM